MSRDNPMSETPRENTGLFMSDPIASRWPDDTAAGLLEDVAWLLDGASKGRRVMCDDLMVEKVRVLAAALVPVKVRLYDAATLGQMTTTVAIPNAPLTVRGPNAG